MDGLSIRLQKAIAAARAGQTMQARELAQQVTHEEPESKHAWLLLSTLSESAEEQATYLNQALTIDPDFEPARQRLAQLDIPSAVQADAVDEAMEEALEQAGEGFEEPDAGLETVVAAPARDLDEIPEYEETILAEPAADLELADEAFETLISAAASEGFYDEAGQEDEPEPAGEGAFPEEEFWEPETRVSGELASLMEQAEAAAVPSWLAEAGGFAEPGETGGEEPQTEVAAAGAIEEVPDWLMDEPGEDWLEQELAEAEELESPEWAGDKTFELALESEALGKAMEAPEPALDEVAAAEVGALSAEERAKAKAKARRKRSPTRTYEIILAILIVLAILVVAALAYVIIVPPF
jgi:hypothetical protein